MRTEFITFRKSKQNSCSKTFLFKYYRTGVRKLLFWEAKNYCLKSFAGCTFTN